MWCKEYHKGNELFPSLEGKGRQKGKLRGKAQKKRGSEPKRKQQVGGTISIQKRRAERAWAGKKKTANCDRVGDLEGRVTIRQ